MRASRILRYLGLGLAAAATLYAATWFATAMILRNEAGNWVEGRRAAGVDISYGAAAFSGFPGRVVVDFPNATFVYLRSGSAWTWRAANVRVSTPVLRLRSPTIDLAGEHTFTAPFLPAAVALSAEKALLVLHLDRGGVLTKGDLESSNVVLRTDAAGPVVMSLENGVFGLGRTKRPDGGEETSSRLTIDATNLRLPVAVPPLGGAVDHLRLVLDIQGPVTRGALPKILEAWRTAGGDMEAREFALDWPPISITGNGTLALDENLQPLAAFSLKVGGFFAVVDILTQRGAIKTEAASLAKLVLGLLAKSPPGGGAPELNLAFTVQDQKLQVGPVTLMDVPKIGWPTDVVVP